MREDGTLDVSPKGTGTLSYEFNSVARGDADLTVSFGPIEGQSKERPVGVSWNTHTDHMPRDPIAKPKCTCARAFEALSAAGKLEKADPRRLEFTLGAKSEKTTWRTAVPVVGKPGPRWQAEAPQWIGIDGATCDITK